jgi:hypothetical protein
MRGRAGAIYFAGWMLLTVGQFAGQTREYGEITLDALYAWEYISTQISYPRMMMEMMCQQHMIFFEQGIEKTRNCS